MLQQECAAVKLNSTEGSSMVIQNNNPTTITSILPNTDIKTDPHNQVVPNNGIIAGATSAAEVSLMSMPMSVPLSGLTTIPLALCPMNRQGNIVGTNAVQPAGGIVPQPGLVLLNVGGNTAGLSKILASPNQLQQPLQQMQATSDSNNQLSAAQQLLLPQVQTQNNVASFPQVLSPIAQMPMQPSVLPQQAPAAYMLVPIHHLPTSQSIVQQQQFPGTNFSTAQAQHTTLQNVSLSSMIGAAGSLPQVLGSPVTPFSVNANQISPSLQTVTQSNVSYTLPNALAPTMVIPHPISTPPTPQSIPICTNPINDPHISSSVPGKDVPPTPSALNESLETKEKINLHTLSNQAVSHAISNESCSIKPISTVSTPLMLAKQDETNYTVSSISPIQHAPAEDTPRKAPEKRKKGPAPKLDGNELCIVCGDKASGYHYGVLSCEGCKGFFRRCIIKTSQYQCKEKGECRMDSFTRRKCQACRLRKCRAAGMKDESVFSEVHSGGKAKRIKRNVTDNVSPNPVAPDPSLTGDRIPTLTSQQLNIVEMLQANENRYQWPSQEDVEKVTPWMEAGDSHRPRSQRFNHFTELTILIVQLVVEFTKQLPGFLDVTREDQIILLKACTIEVMLLRAAKQYDKTSKAINVLNGRHYDKSSFYRAGMQVEFVDPIFDFCQSMARLNLDEAEYALLVAINTFSTDRPNLKDLKKIEAVQDAYVELLRVYLKIHHPNDPLMFPRTLMKLVELRTLSNHHSEQMFALKVQDKQLPPLLAEIWDM